MIKDKDNYLHSELTEEIIGQAFIVYNALGSGFLENVYKKALTKKLREKVIIELKAIEALNKIHEVQLVNYLKATDIEVGLLINFGNKIEFKRKVFSKNHKNLRNQRQ